jgi:hypothetical protein
MFAMARSSRVENARRGPTVIRGTVNIFADLGLPDAAERQVKLRLAYALNQLLAARNAARISSTLAAVARIVSTFCTGRAM